MRRSIWTRILAVLLVVSMLSVPVSAAGWNSRSSGWGNWGWGNWGGFWGGWFDGGEEEEPEPTEPETELTLVEDYSTVENGELLRASTYALTTTEESETLSTAPYASVNAYGAVTTADDTSSTTTVKYFPVTMYDYDASTMREATNKVEVEAGVGDVWNGIYFSGGTPSATSYSTDSDVVITFDEDNNALIPDGDYVLYSSGNGKYVTNNVGYSAWGTYTLTATSSAGEATRWTITKQDDGSYTIQDPDGMYMNISGRNTSGLSEDPVYMSIYKDDSGNVVVKQLNASNDYCYLNALGGSGYSNFGGWTNGSPVSIESAEGSVTLEYAAHNFWNKKSGSNANGDLIWTGLAQQTMIDDQIVFNVPDGGIFNDDTSVKDIYEYVGLPFTFVDGKYTFDSDINGVYFENGTPQSGTVAEPYNMVFVEGNPQPKPSDLSVGDGSTNAWFPYNAESSYSTSQVNYHFGMRADLPFSMTANGRVKSTDDSSDPIVFTFSGDDDVWVYVDGNLVIDMGGIHNRLDVTIDFAANTVTYSEENAQDSNNTTGSYNDSANFATTQKLFTDSEGTGLINMTRDAFAAVEDHELQFFYLERGEGTSNCQIQFNLPMNDTVLVTKDATQSWNPDTDEIEDLTDTEQAIVDAINFGFTLYKKADGESAYTAVANTNYYLLDASGNRIAINSTDANGKFYLKNGQTAKFITEIPTDGVSYYVVEDTVPDGFVTPDFNFDGVATNGFDYVDANGTTTHVTAGNLIPEQVIATDATVNKSYEVTAYGSVEANDSVQFICSNYLNATLPNPSIFANEDIIVIDYGLPVQIDPLANDLFRGDTIEILYVGSENVTVTETEDADGVKSATWTTDDTIEFGTVELVKGTLTAADSSRDTLVYTLNEQLTEVEVLTYVVQVTGNYTNETTGKTVTQTATMTGKVYIVPATIMYYEENFSDMVTFTGSNWVGLVETAGKSDYQEPGVVGTPDDSTYGSDVAYLSDSFDSNGTSYYGDTTTGAMKFEYTFTGTGSSFFARTSKDTGYMQVKVYTVADDGTETLKDTFYRDTYYEDTNNSDLDQSGTLYNIPVFSTGDMDYGTYKVVVTVAKAGTKNAGGADGSGKDFYLDGIRVMQPLNEDNQTVINAETGETITDKALGAYATDGEANIEVVTLRYKMITDAELNTTPWNFVVLTDTDGQIVTVENYKGIGPKEEVYLNEGQTVSFALKYWQTDGLMLYMGMKAPFGSAQVQVGQTTYNLANTTDCYYDVTSNYSSLVTKYEEDGTPYYVATFTFTATDSIVSLTNIKVVGNYEFTIVENVGINGD